MSSATDYPLMPQDRERVPRILLRAIALLLITVLSLVTLARVTGMEPSAMPPANVPIVKERMVRIYADMNGNARVLDEDGNQIADLDPTKGGFIAGVWRSMALKRKPYGIDPGAPVRIVKFADGRLGLRDDLTGWRVELIGFGKDNTRAFAKLLEQ